MSSDNSSVSSSRVIRPREHEHYLGAGDLLFSHTPCRVTTVLGSCVAVVFHSAKARMSAICHAMLPAPPPGCLVRDDDPVRWKYVSHVVPIMCDYFRDHGLAPSSITVKVFGGSALIGPRKGESSVGASNVALARKLLAERGYTIHSSDVGGLFGRKVVFETCSGTVFIKRVGKGAAPG